MFYNQTLKAIEIATRSDGINHAFILNDRIRREIQLAEQAYILTRNMLCSALHLDEARRCTDRLAEERCVEGRCEVCEIPWRHRIREDHQSYWIQPHSKLWVSDGENGIFPGVRVEIRDGYEGLVVKLIRGKRSFCFGVGTDKDASYRTIQTAIDDLLRAANSNDIRKKLGLKPD